MNPHQEWLFKAIVSFVALTLASCSFLAPSDQQMQITTNPPNATIQIDHVKSGTSPLEIRIKRDQPHSITVSKLGYQTENRGTHTTMSRLGVLDSIGTRLILLPIIGLFSSGSTYQKPDHFNITLSPSPVPKEEDAQLKSDDVTPSKPLPITEEPG